MKFPQKFLSISCILLVLTGVTLASVLAQGTQLQAVATPLEKAMMGVGGEDALQNLSTLSIEAGGVRWVHDEGFTPGGADLIGPFQMTVQADLAGDNLRVGHVFGSGDNARELSEIIAGDLGILDGRNSIFGPPAVGPMLSDRWASIRKHQRLMNPHLLLIDLLANPELASDGGEVLHDGTVHHVLNIEDEIAPIQLLVNAGTGQIAKLSTMESETLRRDVSVELFYYSWQPVGDRYVFPAEVYVAYDGDIVHKEIRTAIGVNNELDSALFAFPDDVAPEFDADLARRGAAMHQFLQSFVARGFPRDGYQTNIVATEVGPGIFHLTGGSHHSLAVEQEDGVIIVEAPLEEIRSQAVMAWVAENMSGKPVTHVISSHHHVDHSGGLREYVANGATAVVHEAAQAFFADFFQTSSMIIPDTMEGSPVTPTFATVPADGSFTLDDSLNSVSVYPMENTHAEDFVITHIEQAGVVFIVDLYNPNPAAENLPPGGQLLSARIAELELDVSTIAGGHGGTIDFETFAALPGAQ